MDFSKLVSKHVATLSIQEISGYKSPCLLFRNFLQVRHGEPLYGNSLTAHRAELMEILNTNVAGPLRMTQTFLDLVKKSRMKKVVNISSLLGSIGTRQGNTVGSKFLLLLPF